MSDEAWLEAFPLLVKYQIAEIKDGKYIYSRLFEGSVAAMKLNPPGRIEQVRMGRKVREQILPLMIQHAKVYRSRKDVENMIAAYVCVMFHTKRHNIGIPNDSLPAIVWGTWWLNDNEPEVGVNIDKTP